MGTLRGESNKYVVNSELKSIKENIILGQKNGQYDKTYSISTLLKKYFKIMTDPTFFKPFGVLLLVFAFACEWTGAINLQAYFVSIMRESKIPMNPYWAGALVETIRAFMSLLGLAVNKKFKKRPIYLTCCAILW